MVKELLQLGDPRLYTVSSEVTKEELPQLQSVIQDLRDTVMDNRRSYGFGKALAAPQIGVFKRLIYFRTEQTVGELISQAFGLAEDALAKHHILFINPVISYPDEETMSVTDECMSFPNLLVKVERHKRCTITYRDKNWEEHSLELEGELAGILQHEVDHLDGILSTQRAKNTKAFYSREVL